MVIQRGVWIPNSQPFCLVHTCQLFWILMDQAALKSSSLLSSKGVELLVCDLLLTMRTSLWQRGGGSNGEPGPAPGSQLAGFQRDLSALRRLGQCYRQAQHKVHCQIQYVTKGTQTLVGTLTVFRAIHWGMDSFDARNTDRDEWHQWSQFWNKNAVCVHTPIVLMCQQHFEVR